MDCDTSMSVLNTPIKKIRNLTLHSPKPPSPIRYPSMSDFPVKSEPIFHNMVEKGYSQTISNKVLRELDSRASEISSRLGSTPSAASSAAQKKKRYSGIHRPLFSKMESILSHYAASRTNRDNSLPVRDFPSSATKKRRTLNGPEEIFGLDKENESPTRRKGPNGQREQVQNQNCTQTPVLGLAPSLLPTSNHITPRLSPSRNQMLHSSPIRQEPSASRVSSVSPTHSGSSPGKFSKISPSKGSMNLNLLLHGDDEFVKPAVPKLRQSSLQMAGVTHNFAPSMLNSSIPTLAKKPSIPSLQKKTSIPSLQKKPSIPSLQKKTSIPSLQKKPSVPTFGQKQSPAFPKPLTLNKKPSIPTLQKKPSVPSFKNSTIPRDVSSTLHKKPSSSNITVPKPFSLYDRPTISSSQKSLAGGQVTASASNRSINSLQSLASQRSLNRFQKFKSRFS